MPATRSLLRFFAVVLLLPVLPASAQGDREGAGLSREQMWPAPTAEDWARPCLITWQRTWEDAVAVSRETGKPILVCINMDGEIASEHYAGVRYRQPEVTALYEPYVTVIASVYRHNPRDYDDNGERILCPRFGSVTCGEHIWIEPIIFEKFCDGRRVAPRHICVDLEGAEVYDVYYTNDTASVFDAVRDERAKLPPAKEIVVRGDRPIVERVESRDIVDRVAVERAYREGDEAQKRALLEAALKHGDAAPVDLLRQAIFGLDVELSQAARRALAELNTTDATQLLSDALQVPMDASERDALIASLSRLGESWPRARWLAGIHQGLSGSSTSMDVSGWAAWQGGGEYPAPKLFGGAGRLTYIESTAEAVEENPEDPATRLDLAEATLALALRAPETYATNPRLAGLAARHLYADAKGHALRAEELDATPWRVNTVLALAAYYTGDTEEAYERAAAAVKELPSGDTGWNSMAVVTVFAEGRWKTIKAAVREGKPWPPEYLSDLHAAYSVLMRHPLGTDRQVLWHYDLLDWLGIRHRANRVLREGLERFPDSAVLHERMCADILKFAGPERLQEAYDRLLGEVAGPARILPYAAAGSVQVAEQHRRARAPEKARAAYARAIDLYERAIEADPANRATADPAVALALGGRARLAYELGEDDAALADLLACFARHPEAAGTRDGMGITPGETAQMLLARLREAGKEGDAAKLAAALAGLDPELLRPDRGLEEPQ